MFVLLWKCYIFKIGVNNPFKGVPGSVGFEVVRVKYIWIRLEDVERKRIIILGCISMPMYNQETCSEYGIQTTWSTFLAWRVA